MADLGDVGTSKRAAPKERIMFLDPGLLITGANRDYSSARAYARRVAFAGPHARSKPGQHVIAAITGAPSGQNIVLSKHGVFVETRRSLAGSVAFYDLDDGVYHAASTASAAAWRVTVAGTDVTVEALGGGGGPELPTYGQIFPSGR